MLRVNALESKAKASGTPEALRLLAGRGSDGAPGATDNDLALSQHLDLFGRSRLAAAVDRAEAEVARADVRRVQLEVQTEVLGLYNDAVAATGKLAIAKELVEIATRFRDAAKRRTQAGDVPEVQLLRAGIELERASQVQELREAESMAALARLRGAAGQFNGPVSPSFFSRTPAPGSKLAQNRPDLLVLAAEIKLIDERIRQERSATRPDIELQLRRSPWMENAQVGLRLQVSVPITDYGRTKSSVKSLRLTRQAAEMQRDDALQLAEGELRSLMVERAAAQSQVARLESLILDAKELMRINQKGFEAGALTLIESLEAARALREIEEALLQAQLQLARIDVALAATEGFLLEEGK